MKLLILSVVVCSLLACSNSQTAAAKQAIDDSTKRAQDSISKIIQLQKQEIEKLQAEKELDEQQKIESQKQQLLDHLNEYLVAIPDFKPLGFGGFTDGKIHLQNKTKISFEKATVLVQVILDNGSVYSNEFYTAENLDPGEIKTLTLPNASRGTSIKAKVVKVKSELLTNGVLIDVPDKND